MTPTGRAPTIVDVKLSYAAMAFGLVVIARSGPVLAQDVGAILLPEADRGTIVEIAEGGDLAEEARFASGLSFPVAVCQGPGGVVYALELASGELTRVTGGGDVSGRPAYAYGLSEPLALHCDNNRILVGEQSSGRILDVTAGGDFSGAAPFATIPFPTDIAVSSSGRLLASSSRDGIYDITAGGAGVLSVVDDRFMTGSMGLGRRGNASIVAVWGGNIVLAVSSVPTYSVAPTVANIIAPISLLTLPGGRLLVATWPSGSNGGSVFEVVGSTPQLFATGVSPYVAAEMAYIQSRCGDGVVTGAEECDDDNGVNTDSCLNSCRFARCGDGIVREGVEECDDGNQRDGDSCLSTCVPNVCGDEILNLGVEECDDGNDDDRDGCRANCTVGLCGDGIVEEGIEECDDGNSNNRDACLVGCFAATCGDGYVERDVEECDDGNDIDGDDCRNDCTLPFCGNGVVDRLESCDDGNSSDQDACRNDCARARCGDGIVQAPDEECDDGNDDRADGCNRCALSYCGDGVTWRGVEECDDGDNDENDLCLSTCFRNVCGDGILLFGSESCDDGNNSDGDGCDRLCQKEFDVVGCASRPGTRSSRPWLLGIVFAVGALVSRGARRRRLRAHRS